MNQHIYLRAYMAGVVVPTIFLLVVATVFTIARYIYNIPVPVERVIVFPMAVVPNAWGLWNVLFVALRSRLQLSLGLHGALLPIRRCTCRAAPVLLRLEIPGGFSQPCASALLSFSNTAAKLRLAPHAV